GSGLRSCRTTRPSVRLGAHTSSEGSASGRATFSPGRRAAPPVTRSPPLRHARDVPRRTDLPAPARTRPRAAAPLVLLALVVAVFVALWAASHLTVAGQQADAGAFRTLAPLHDVGRDVAGALRRGLPVACAVVATVLGLVALVRRAWRDLIAAV